MPETKQRMIVDGVEFGQVFAFPLLFRAITWAFGPSRLLVALFMVIALVAMGRLWDAVTEPNVQPSGLAAGRAMEEAQEEHQRALRDALRAFAPDAARSGELQTRDVL